MRLKHWPMVGVTALFLTADIASAQTNRVISADLKQVKGPRSMTWQDCVGAGRVAEGLRGGWRQQLEEAHREIGFKYIRMHGLLQDELGVYSENRDGEPRYNWQYIDDVYDYLLSIGMKPFVEFGFMPNDLASGTAKIFWWNANVTPPKDYAKWDGLITALVKHWTERYGENEVKTWRFEVWNEPNYPGFWHPPEGTTPREAYFEMYVHTARAVKNVSTNYAVGGPAGAGPVWTAELINLCQHTNAPIDFISYHAYGLGGGPSGLDEYGNNKLYLSSDMHAVAKTANSQLPIIKKSAQPNLPVPITEWSASYSPRDPVHDAYFSAPFILDQLRRTEAMSSMSYWTFTDVFEENGPAPRPFHGGFGLINYQDIRKPAFWAYKFLASLGRTELQNTDDCSYVCVDEHGAQVLLWDLTHPTGDKVSDQEYFFKEHPAVATGNVTIQLKNLKRGSYRLTVQRIGYQHHDAYSRYLELGQPTDISRETVADLKKLSNEGPVIDKKVSVPSSGEFATSLPLCENDVYFLSLARQ